MRFLDANKPDDEFKIFNKRVEGHEYSISHFKDNFYIITNKDNSKNFKLMRTSLKNTNQKNWKKKKISARFVCALTIYGLKKKPIHSLGIIEGKISKKKLGKNGFGYDPIFIPKNKEEKVIRIDLTTFEYKSSGIVLNVEQQEKMDKLLIKAFKEKDNNQNELLMLYKN